MKRIMMDALYEWKNSNTKEPLLITGARQVGKTWLIREFCRKAYPESVYINFESQPEMLSVFENSLEPESIIKNLEILTGKRIYPEETVLIFDEIQKSERAITSLKYFCEADINYRVIGAGSLLGVKIHRFQSSFPVGKVKILNMGPMRFDEFLVGCGEELLVEAIREAYSNMKALPDAVHQKANDLYRDYLFVGGMPNAILNYIANDKKVLRFDRSIHRDLLTAYAADMTKYTYTPAEAVKISQVYQSVPGQLAKENPKFMYKDIREYANKRDFSTSLDWLIASGLVIKTTNVSIPRSPLHVYEEEGMFKIYLSDVGLLGTAAGVQFRDLLPETDNIYKGAMAENYLLQTLSAGGMPGFYYKPSQNLEIDQLIDVDGSIIPIEIKAGRHKRSTSLKKYIESFQPIRAYRFSENHFGKTDNLYSVPLYAAFCL